MWPPCGNLGLILLKPGIPQLSSAAWMGQKQAAAQQIVCQGTLVSEARQCYQQSKVGWAQLARGCHCHRPGGFESCHGES